MTRVATSALHCDAKCRLSLPGYRRFRGFQLSISLPFVIHKLAYLLDGYLPSAPGVLLQPLARRTRP